MANVELLERTLAHIEANPELWDQECWFSGPAEARVACFAGRACLLAGLEVAQGTFSYVDVHHHAPPMWPDGLMPVASAAQKKLELCNIDAVRLFCPGNTLEDLRRIVGLLCS
jgi:hypothetical protein